MFIHTSILKISRVISRLNLVSYGKKKMNKKSVELDKVKEIRDFFDSQTGYQRIDPLSQMYISFKFNTQEAKKFNVSLDQLRSLFSAYCQKPEYAPRKLS